MKWNYLTEDIICRLEKDCPDVLDLDFQKVCAKIAQDKPMAMAADVWRIASPKTGRLITST